MQRDRRLGRRHDPGIESVVTASLAWLRAAQDHSRSADGGVARHFSLIDGWSTSYPETTGYIIPTILDCAERSGSEDLRRRARNMVDWLVRIQLEGGGFQGGVIGQTPVVPVTFNTGQILFGLAAGVRSFGEAYRPALERAGDWLVETQDDDGCWRRNPSPFAEPGEKTYETHVAWGLLEADRVSGGRGYAEAALRNVRWALTKQRANGWFESCGLVSDVAPLTHTIGYALRGVLEAHRFSGDSAFLEASVRTGDALLTVLGKDGHLAGRFNAEWRATVDWACLTGIVQIAACWLMLYEATGDTRYRNAAFLANAYVRRHVDISGPVETRGGVKGSYPVDGWYGPFQYLNWAAKFFIDANLYELAIRSRESA